MTEAVTPFCMYAHLNQLMQNDKMRLEIRGLDQLKRTAEKDTTKRGLPRALELALLNFWIEHMQNLRANELSNPVRQRMGPPRPQHAVLVDGHSPMHTSLTRVAPKGSIDRSFNAWFSEYDGVIEACAEYNQGEKLAKLVTSMATAYNDVISAEDDDGDGKGYVLPTPQEMYMLLGRPLVWPEEYDVDDSMREAVLDEANFKQKCLTWPELQLLWTIPNSQYVAHVLTLKMMGQRLVDDNPPRGTGRLSDLYFLGVDVHNLADAWLRKYLSPSRKR